MTLRLAPGSALVAAAILEQQRCIVAALPTLESASVEDVHAARVAARRLRSMLKTFRPLLDQRRARLYRADLRSFAQSLGSAREADVRSALLRSVARADRGIGAADRRRLVTLLNETRSDSREQLRRRVAEPEWAALCKALQRHPLGQALLAVRDAQPGAVMERVGQAWRRPVRLMKRPPESADELHELRLAFKHCRYALEPLTDVAPEATLRLLRRLRAAQDRLGEHRDTLLAGHWVREQEPVLGEALVRRLLDDLAQRELDLRQEAVARAGRVLDAWQAWRDATREFRKPATPGRP